MTRSRLLWFAGIFVLIVPILVAVYRDGGELGAEVLLWAVGTGGAIAVVNALIWGKGPVRD